MDQPQRFVLRVVYVKRDRLALLSHLEVARALERTVRRSGLPFAVSQGFSPHMKIAFGAALPVGVGSTCEIFDIQLTEYVACDRALDALKRASVPDLMVQSAQYLGAGQKAASVAYPISEYEAVLSYAPGALVVPDQIVRQRKNKKDKTLQVSDYLVGELVFSQEDPKRLRFLLEAHNEGSLRPDLFIGECVRLYNEKRAASEIAHEESGFAGSSQEATEALLVKSITRVSQRSE